MPFFPRAARFPSASQRHHWTLNAPTQMQATQIGVTMQTQEDGRIRAGRVLPIQTPGVTSATNNGEQLNKGAQDYLGKTPRLLGPNFQFWA